MLKTFRRSLYSKHPPEGEIKYCVVISLPKIHCHPPQVKGQYLNDEVKAAMHYVLRCGITSVESIQKKLYQIVDQEFENDPIKPSRDNSAFYPNQKTIYNHLRRDGLKIKRPHKKNSTQLTELKIKMNKLLNFILVKISECYDLNILTQVYKKCQSVEDILENHSEEKI